MNFYPSARTVSDAALVSRTRRGDAGAFRTLVARHHEPVRLAVSLMGAPTSLVGATFDVARGCLLRESSSSSAVRPFVLHLAHRLAHAPDPARDLVRGDACPGAPFREQLGSWPTIAVAVAGLPPACQAVLWHRVVERDADDAIAATIGAPTLKVPVLVRVATDLLHRTLLVHHRKGSPPQCLGHGLRLERADVGIPRAFLRHARECPRCTGLLGDLTALDSHLSQVLAESLLGAAGEAYRAVRAHSVDTTAAPV